MLNFGEVKTNEPCQHWTLPARVEFTLSRLVPRPLFASSPLLRWHWWLLRELLVCLSESLSLLPLEMEDVRMFHAAVSCKEF